MLPSGAIDYTFDIGTGFDGGVKDIKILADGSILVVGDFTIYNGTNVNRIVKLRANGTLDTSFHHSSGFNGQVFSVDVFSDGKILVGGTFLSYNGSAASKFIRINNCIASTSTVQLFGVAVRVSPTELKSNFTGSAYQWYTCDGTPVSGETSRNLVNPGAGSYYVSVTTACGVLTSQCIEVECLSAEAIQNEVACSSFTWINGVEYFESTTATHMVSGAAQNGCDCLITLNLTIEDISAPVPSIANLPDLYFNCMPALGSYPTAYDACDGSISAVLNGTMPTTFGTHTLEWHYIDVLNALGQIVLGSDVIGLNEFNFMIDDAAGIYTVRIQSNEGVSTHKLNVVK